MTVSSNTVTVTVVGSPCLTTIQGWWSGDYNPNGGGPGIGTGTKLYADLVSEQTAAQLLGVSSAVGAYAVYQIRGGYTEEQFLYPGFGGRVGNTWGLLQGYGYCPDGSCATSGSCPPRPQPQTFVIAAVTASATCDIPYTGTQAEACALAASLVGKYEDSVPGGCYHEIVTSAAVWLGAQRIC